MKATTTPTPADPVPGTLALLRFIGTTILALLTYAPGH